MAPGEEANDGTDFLATMDLRMKISFDLNARMNTEQAGKLYQELKRVCHQSEKSSFKCLPIILGGILVFTIVSLLVWAILAAIQFPVAGIVIAFLVWLIGSAAAIGLGLFEHTKVSEYNSNLDVITLSFEFDEAHWKRYSALIRSLDLASQSGLAIGRSPPRFVESNLDLRSVRFDHQTAYFFPDRLVIFSPRGMCFVTYAALSVKPTFVIQSGTWLPKGAVLLSQHATWSHSRVDGGPDRRYKYNPQTTRFEFKTGFVVLFAGKGLRLEMRANNPDATDRIADEILRIGGRAG